MIEAKTTMFLIRFEISDLKIVDMGAKNVQIGLEMSILECFVKPVLKTAKNLRFPIFCNFLCI